MHSYPETFPLFAFYYHTKRKNLLQVKKQMFVFCSYQDDPLFVFLNIFTAI